MRVKVMYRSTDGWTYYPIGIEIADNCPIFGQKRGEPYPYNFCEDGEWFVVDRWDNPCGHIDKYRDCIKEAKIMEQPCQN